MLRGTMSSLFDSPALQFGTVEYAGVAGTEHCSFCKQPISGQGIFFLVAAGSGYRVFTKDMPAHHNRGIAVYFAAILIFFALILRALPPSGLVSYFSDANR